MATDNKQWSKDLILGEEVVRGKQDKLLMESLIKKSKTCTKMY